MFGLLRKLFILVFFAALTFGFVVLFEHGPDNYQANARKEWNKLYQTLRQYWDKRGS